MESYVALSQELIQQLRLEQPPIAISFSRPMPPEGVASYMARLLQDAGSGKMPPHQPSPLPPATMNCAPSACILTICKHRKRNRKT